MADFAGFDIETPQEVLARVQEQNGTLQADAQRDGTTRAIDQANTQIALNGLFGSLNAKQAENKGKEYIGAVAEALRVLPATASSEERTQARSRAMFDTAVLMGDPTVALQAAQQEEQALVATRERQDLLNKSDLEKRRVEQGIATSKVAQTRAELDLKIDQEAAAMETGVSSDFSLTRTFDNRTERGRATRAQWLTENPGGFIGPSMDVLTTLHQDTAKGSSIGINQLSRTGRNLAANVTMLDQATLIMDVVGDNPGALSIGGKITGAGSRVTQQLEGAINTAAALFGSPKELDLVNADIAAKAKEFNLDDTLITGMFAPLVFSITVAANGSRPTDADYTRIARALAGEKGQVDPDAVANMIEATVRGNGSRALEESRAWNSPALTSHEARLENRMTLFDSSLDTLRDKRSNFESASTRAVAKQTAQAKERAGIAPAPADAVEPGDEPLEDDTTFGVQ